MEILNTRFDDIFSDEVEKYIYQSICNNLEQLEKKQFEDHAERCADQSGIEVANGASGTKLFLSTSSNSQDAYVTNVVKTSEKEENSIPVSISASSSSPTSSLAETERFLDVDIYPPNKSNTTSPNQREIKNSRKKKRSAKKIPSVIKINKKRKGKHQAHNEQVVINLSKTSDLTKSIHQMPNNQCLNNDSSNMINKHSTHHDIPSAVVSKNSLPSIVSTVSLSSASTSDPHCADENSQVQTEAPYFQTFPIPPLLTDLAHLNSIKGTTTAKDTLASLQEINYRISFMREKLCYSLEKSTESKWQITTLTQKETSKNNPAKQKRKKYKKNLRCLIFEKLALEQLESETMSVPGSSSSPSSSS